MLCNSVQRLDSTLGQQCADCVALHSDLDILSQFHGDVLITSLKDFPDKTAIRHDFVTHCETIDHATLFLGAFALWADQQEIENDKNDDQRQ